MSFNYEKPRLSVNERIIGIVKMRNGFWCNGAVTKVSIFWVEELFKIQNAIVSILGNQWDCLNSIIITRKMRDTLLFVRIIRPFTHFRQSVLFFSLFFTNSQFFQLYRYNLVSSVFGDYYCLGFLRPQKIENKTGFSSGRDKEIGFGEKTGGHGMRSINNRARTSSRENPKIFQSRPWPGLELIYEINNISLRASQRQRDGRMLQGYNAIGGLIKLPTCRA